ncbi:MAG: hydrolase [Patescibacteria group bacterium]|jgi:hypothetical protein
MNNQIENQVCCPKFDPTQWDNKEFIWDNKKFIKDKVFTLFFMPINFGAVMKRLQAKVEQAGATINDYLCLSEHASKWHMDIFLAVDKDIPNAENVTLSGKFFSKVYEGNFKDTGTWMKDFESVAKSKNFTVSKTYLWYTTCPKCAKTYGKNYVVIVGKL